MTGTADPARQLAAITDLHEKFEMEYMAKLRANAQTSLSCFVEYMTPEEPPALHHEFICEHLEAIERRDIMRAAFSMAPGHAKGCALDTPLPTPTGWTTVGEVEIGEDIYGVNGAPTKVIGKSSIFTDKRCFRAITSDDCEITVSEDHLWDVRLDTNAKYTTTHTTLELFQRQGLKSWRPYRLPEVKPVERPDATLPIDPYLLGVWLGNGTVKTGVITSHVGDRDFFIGQFSAAGFTVIPRVVPLVMGVHDLAPALAKAGVLEDKHVPDVYLTASAAQRLELLRGLMDTDGHARKNGGCIFTNTRPALINAVRKILWSLGVPNTVTLCGVHPHDDGYNRAPCWNVYFSGVDCFHLPRKKQRLGALKSRYGRYIRFEEIPIEPTQCLVVDAPDSLFLAGAGHIPTHNSKFCSKYFPAWYLGKHPRHKYIQGGHSQSFAENEFGKATRDIIDEVRYRDIFPEVRLHPRSTAGGAWRLDNPRGSYIAKGVGQKIAGFRGNCGGGDDLIGSREDADSQLIRDKVWNWLWSDYRTRFLPGSPIFMIATRWHPDDPIGRIEQRNKQGVGIPWTIINLNVIIENEREMLMDPMGRSIGEVLWPDYYTYEQIMELKATLPLRDWLALYKGQPRLAEGNIVKAVWFQEYDEIPRDKIQENGRAYERVVRRITVSVDTASKAKQRNNHTVASVWLETTAGHHYLLDVRRKRVEFTELIPFIEDTAKDWGASAILVEDKGNGTAYLQLRQGLAPAPLIAINPDAEGDKEFRFDSVTPMFEAGLVHVPKQAPWLPDYLEEVLAFPTGEDDQVDSTSQYLSWARRRLSLGTRKLRGGGINRQRRNGRGP